jgi:hypothetical protein
MCNEYFYGLQAWGSWCPLIPSHCWMKGIEVKQIPYNIHNINQHIPSIGWVTESHNYNYNILQNYAPCATVSA